MRRASLVVLGIALAPLAACGGGWQVGYGPSTVGVDLDRPPGPSVIAHEPCGESGEPSLARDHDGDGKNDTLHVALEGREVCRAIDTNKDGKPDTWVYFDPNGGVRRQERDHNHDGTVDEVTHFKAGLIEKSERDSNHDGRVDEWIFHDENGKPLRALHDRDGNGKVDQWWSWLPNKKGCATIHTDRNEDGKSDHAHETCPPGATSSPAPVR